MRTGCAIKLKNYLLTSLNAAVYSPMYTKAQYEKGEVGRSEYFGQFVSPRLVGEVHRVCGRISAARKVAEIPPMKLDRVVFGSGLKHNFKTKSRLAEAGDEMSHRTAVLIVCEAVRQARKGRGV